MKSTIIMRISLYFSFNLSDIKLLGNPSNGITDQLSAEMLALELDALDNTSLADSSLDDKKEKMSLDLKGGDRERGDICIPQSEYFQEADWQLLDVYFGIPLFNPQLNKDVCQKIVSLSLFKEDRYVKK